MRGSENDRVVVIGAGLAGLTAAATAARAGQEVVLVEAHRPGGRARTDSRGGYLFNQGPHALYRGGPAWRILRELGVPHHGHNPPFRGMLGVRDGKLVRLLRGTPIASIASKLAAGRSAPRAGKSTTEWIDVLSLRPSEAELLRVGARCGHLRSGPGSPAGGASRRTVAQRAGAWRVLPGRRLGHPRRGPRRSSDRRRGGDPSSRRSGRDRWCPRRVGGGDGRR